MTDTTAADQYRVVQELGSGTQHAWELPTDEDTLLALVSDVFTHYWPHIHFGVLIQGAAWEVAAPNEPANIAMMDGFATIDFGRWHFHLCIGEHTASGEELGRIRRTSRAELYRGIGRDDTPTTWGLRMFNGRGEQQMTVMLPNPFLTDTQQLLDEPDFDRLAAWDFLRQKYLGLDPDPFDRTGTGFKHS